MKNENIATLEKNKITNKAQTAETAEGCCGGTPINTEEACCKLDEEKKAEGEAGCGCSTTAEAESTTKTSCC